MSDTKPVNATLELVYVPDTYTDTERQEGASWPLGSGFYDLVAVAGDARIPLHRFKAGAIDKTIAQAKERRENEQAQQQQQPAPEQPQPAQPQQPAPEQPQQPPSPTTSTA